MTRNEPFAITISREIGSGGHTVGRILAEKLNTRYCDKDLIRALEKKFNLTAGRIEKLKSEKKDWLSDFLRFINPAPTAAAFGVNPALAQEFPVDVTPEDIYLAEKEILKELAEEGSCVIAGRSGFFVLKDHPNHLHVFITASKPNRIRRVMRKQGLEEPDATALVEAIDRARENYIRRFADTSRYDLRNYDLVINADGRSEEQIADFILQFFVQQAE